MTTQHLQTAELSASRNDRLQALMTQLIDVCTDIGRQRDEQGRWQPATSGCDDALGDAREVLADLSRTLAKTRRGLRAIAVGAQRRVQHQHSDILRPDLP